MPITITDTMNANHTIVAIPDKASTKVILIKIEWLIMFCKMIMAIFVHAIASAPRRFWR
jgi:hypothetical protein